MKMIMQYQMFLIFIVIKRWQSKFLHLLSIVRVHDTGSESNFHCEKMFNIRQFVTICIIECKGISYFAQNGMLSFSWQISCYNGRWIVNSYFFISQVKNSLTKIISCWQQLFCSKLPFDQDNYSKSLKIFNKVLFLFYVNSRLVLLSLSLKDVVIITKKQLLLENRYYRI